MTSDELKTLLKENLRLDLDTGSFEATRTGPSGCYGGGSQLRIRLMFGGEAISEEIVDLPECDCQ